VFFFATFFCKVRQFVVMKPLITESDAKRVTGLNGYPLFCHQRRKKVIIELISKICPKGGTVLDIGCALGDISIELFALGYQVHGIDCEPIRLNKAKKLTDKYRQKVEFEHTSLEEFSTDRTYNIVLLGEVLEHFIDPTRVLRDIKNLLSPAGKVVITTPNMPSLRNRLKFGLLGIFPDNNPEHKYYFDFKKLSHVVSDTGYEIHYFSTRFTDTLTKSKFTAWLEHVVLFWFTYLFPKSGATIFAVIGPKTLSNSST